MKKYLIVSSILIAFIAISFNSPASIVHIDKQELTYADDTTKVLNNNSGTCKELSEKGCTSKCIKDCCDKSSCKAKCDPKNRCTTKSGKDCCDKSICKVKCDHDKH